MGTADFELVIGTKSWSSWSLRAWLALRMAGIPFREVPIMLRHDGTSPEIRKHSPAGQVPILKTEDGIIWESMAILEFAAEAFPEAGLWPEDPAARAHARSVAAEMHAGFQPLRQLLPMDFNGRLELPELSDPELSDSVSANIDRIQAIWQDCRERFGDGGPFLYGHFTNADAMYAPVVSRFRTYGVAVGEVSAIYMAAIFALPAMQEWGAGAATENLDTD